MSNDEKKAPPPSGLALLGSGGAKRAATAIKTRAQRLAEEEKKAVGQKYAKGGPVKRGWGKARC